MPYKDAREIRFGISEQAVFGTATADASTFYELEVDVVDIDRDIRQHTRSTKSGGRQQGYQDSVLTTQGSMPKFTIKGPFCHSTHDILLYSFFQNVVEGAATPWTKNFSYFATQPDFSDIDAVTDTGKILTCIKRFPTASTSWKMENVICAGFKLSGEADGVLMAEYNMVGLGAAAVTSNPSGTWERGLDKVGGADNQAANYDMLFFNDIDICQLKVDDGAATTIPLKRFSIEMSHDVIGVGPDGSGSHANFGISNLVGSCELEWLKDANLVSALSGQESDGYVQTNINWGAATAVVDGEVELIATGKVPPGGFSIVEDALIGGIMKYDLKAATSAGDGLLINMSSATQDRAWAST